MLIRESQEQTKEENIIADNDRENLMKNIEEETNQKLIQDKPSQDESNISTKETEVITNGNRKGDTTTCTNPGGKAARKTKKK